MLLSLGGRRTWYNAWQMSLDKPFASNWGAHLAYTHAKALENGGPDLFALDLPNTTLYARHPTSGSEPNHLVATGIVGLPFDTRFSTSITLGTGPAVQVFDLTAGFDLAGHLATGVLTSSASGNVVRSSAALPRAARSRSSVPLRRSWA